MDHHSLVGVLSIAFLILSLGIHEAAHALVAWRCGDDTAKNMGRLTLNPIVHIDPIMTIALPALLYFTGGFLFGGAKPVPVFPHRLRNPLRDMMLVALAGPMSNLILAFLFILAFKLSVFVGGYAENAILPTVMLRSAEFNLLLTVFNLFPVPPLDGSRVMTYLLPASMRESYVALERFGLLLVVGLVFFVPGFQEVLLGGMDALGRVLWDLTGGDWRF